MSALSLVKKGQSGSDLIDKMIADISKRLVSMQSDIQKCMACIVMHAVECGDVTKADKLLTALGDNKSSALRRDAITAWFVSEGVMRVVESKTDQGKTVKSFGLNKERRAMFQKRVEVEGKPKVLASLIAGKSWVDAKKENDPMVPFDLDKALVALLKRAKKAEQDKVPGSNLDKLTALQSFAAINGIKV